MRLTVRYATARRDCGRRSWPSRAPCQPIPAGSSARCPRTGVVAATPRLTVTIAGRIVAMLDGERRDRSSRSSSAILAAACCGLEPGRSKRELLAARAPGKIARTACCRRDHAGHGAQASVAGDMAVAVVELLEIVHVDEDHRERLSVAQARFHSASNVSSKRRRLARPVSPSVAASSRSFCGSPPGVPPRGAPVRRPFC